MSSAPDSTTRLLGALRFAARKHRDQRRKDPSASPYINHPIDVSELLVRVGGIEDLDVLLGAILHDTIEDTETTAEELGHEFGQTVRRLVEEVTDDKSLPKQKRKDLQVLHAQRLSEGAKQIKIADKICNVRDITNSPPTGWSPERRAEYLIWSRRVVEGCRGASAALAAEFDAELATGEARLRSDES